MREVKPSDVSGLIKDFKRALDAGAEPIAAFDADGTLWNTDIGENFFKYEITNNLVKLPPNAWEFYLEWHEREPIPAYLWLAQINAGKSLKQVLQWAQEAIDSYQKVPVFPHMIEIIAALKEFKVKVYIVTASVQWSVMPAATLVGIDPQNVIGIRTKIDAKGIVTETPEGAVTWREGKPKGLQERTGGKAAFFTAGNSTGDTYLLRSATHMALANVLASPKASYYKSEQELLAEAIEKNWYRITGA